MLKNRLRFGITNPSWNDQHLFVTLVQTARTFLFDCGPLVVPKALAHQIRDVCISHRHMDHLQGFTAFARQVTATREPIRVYGPRGLAKALSGMMQAFEWNYGRELRLRLDVVEILDETRIARTRLNVRQAFRLGKSDIESREPVLHRDQEVEIVGFDLAHHTVPCIGYRLALPDEWHVDATALRAMGAEPGPWLGALLDRLRRGEEPGPDEMVPPKRGADEAPNVSLRRVAAEAVHHRRGYRVGFVTDTGDTPEVRARLREALSGADILFCEAYFAGSEAARAAQNGHLTAVQTGEIAQELDVGELVVTHISPRYPPGRVLGEVRSIFPRTRSKQEFLLGNDELADEAADDC